MTDLLQYGRYCGWSRALEDDPVDELPGLSESLAARTQPALPPPTTTAS